jgi:hypothetical protein
VHKGDPRKYPKNMYKSRVGEALIEGLLREAGNKVRRFGQEWRTTAFQELVPEIFKWVKLSERMRMKPDLAICNLRGHVEGVEVKFMHKDEHRRYLDESDYFGRLESYWPGTRVIIVTLEPPSEDHLEQCHIQVLHPAVPDADLYYLRLPIYEIEEWGVAKELCKIYEQLIKALPVAQLTNHKGGP